jgi:hypothetical protein
MDWVDWTMVAVGALSIAVMLLSAAMLIHVGSGDIEED